jgi:hypothetical protein
MGKGQRFPPKSKLNTPGPASYNKINFIDDILKKNQKKSNLSLNTNKSKIIQENQDIANIKEEESNEY